MKALEHVTERNINGAENMTHVHKRPPRHHIPPHERKGMLKIEFDDRDWEYMNKIFGDEDTANAAAEIIKDAPPEIQIVAVQLMSIIEEVA